MKKRLKPGDRVRVIDPTGTEFTLNEELIVENTEVDTMGTFWIGFDKGDSPGWNPQRFELIKESERAIPEPELRQ